MSDVNTANQCEFERCFETYVVSGGGFNVERARGKTKKEGPLLTSSYSANRDNYFWFA